MFVALFVLCGGFGFGVDGGLGWVCDQLFIGVCLVFWVCCLLLIVVVCEDLRLCALVL